MRTILFSLATVALLTLQSCQSDQRGDTSTDQTEKEDKPEANTERESPTKMIEQLVGEWESTTGGQQGQEDAKRIRFTSEARYILYEGNQKIDSGAYRMNEQLRNLYLESEIDAKTKEFEVGLSNNQLTMKPRETTGQAGDKQEIYRRRQ